MLSFVFWVIIPLAATVQTHTNCNNITVDVGQTATITCSFGRDVSESKHNVDVQRYPLLSPEPKSIIRCNWLAKNPDNPTCRMCSSCSFNGNVTDKLTININNITKDFEGRYFCQLVPSAGIVDRACYVIVREDATVSSNNDIKLSTERNCSNNDAERTRTQPNVPAIKLPAQETRAQPNVPAILLGIVVIVLVCGMVGILFLWRRERNGRNTDIAQTAPDFKVMLNPPAAVMDV